MFLEVYRKARDSAFSKVNILSAFKVSGMNPTRALLVIRRLEERQAVPIGSAESRETTPSGTPNRTVDEERWSYTPTGRSQRRKLLQEMAELCLNTPLKRRIITLDHYMEQTDTQLHIIRDQLTKYETYKRDKTTNRRLMAQGRIFGAPEA
jgi:hypothetical protein